MARVVTLREPFRNSPVLVTACETNRSGGLNKASRRLSFCPGYAGLNANDRQLLQKIEGQLTEPVSFSGVRSRNLLLPGLE
jgi:hypothetical protein